MNKKERIEQLEKEVKDLKEMVENLNKNLNKKINNIPVIPNPYYPQPYDTPKSPWVTPRNGDPPYWWQNAPTCQISYRLEG